VKEWLKSVLNYRSYPKNKTGGPFFWTTLYTDVSVLSSVARRFVADFNVVRLSIGEALRSLLDTQPNSELSRRILSYLHEGLTVPDELAVHALEISLMNMRCKTRGSVFNFSL